MRSSGRQWAHRTSYQTIKSWANAALSSREVVALGVAMVLESVSFFDWVLRVVSDGARAPGRYTIPSVPGTWKLKALAQGKGGVI